MTSTDHRPPLQAVHLPQHDDRAAWQLDRRRFAAFLTAKDLVLGYTRTATQAVASLAERLHLDGLCTMVRRSYGWLLGAASVAARAAGTRGSRRTGLGPDHECGADPGRQGRSGSQHSRQHRRWGHRDGGRLDAAVVRQPRCPAGHLARQQGDRGHAGSHRPGPAAQGPQRPVRSQNLPAKAVGAIARERLLQTLVGRFLPRPWSWLVRIVANIALLPTAVLRDASTVVAGVVPGMHPSPAATPAGTTPAATHPTPTAPVPTVGPAEAPPTTPPAPPFTVEVGEPTRDSDLLEQAVGLEPTQLRYPAPKRSVAKKRR